MLAFRLGGNCVEALEGASLKRRQCREEIDARRMIDGARGATDVAYERGAFVEAATHAVDRFAVVARVAADLLQCGN